MSLKIEHPVSAETIYNHLGIKTPLKAWFKSKCKQLGLKEGLDYEGYKLTPLAYTQLIGQGLKLCSVSGYIWDNLFYGERCMTSKEFADYLEVPHQYIIDAAEAEIEDHQKPPEELGFIKTLHGYCMNTLALHLLTAKLNMVERCRLGGYVSDLNDKAMFEDIFSS